MPLPMKTGGSLGLGRDSMRDSNANVRARHSSVGRASTEVMKLVTAASSIMLPFSSCVFMPELRATDRDLDRARTAPVAGEGDRVDLSLVLYIFLLSPCNILQSNYQNVKLAMVYVCMTPFLSINIKGCYSCAFNLID